jgi:hypothetical protein
MLLSLPLLAQQVTKQFLRNNSIQVYNINESSFRYADSSYSQLVRALGRIIDTHRPSQVPISREVIAKAFSVSPTLNLVKDQYFLLLKQGVTNEGAFLFLKDGQPADLYQWSLLSAAASAGQFNTPSASIEFLRKSAAEINLACDSALLHCHADRYNQFTDLLRQLNFREMLQGAIEATVGLIIPLHLTPTSNSSNPLPIDTGLLPYYALVSGDTYPEEYLTDFHIRTGFPLEPLMPSSIDLVGTNFFQFTADILNFSPQQYLKNYPHVQDAAVPPIQHYLVINFLSSRVPVRGTGDKHVFLRQIFIFIPLLLAPLFFVSLSCIGSCRELVARSLLPVSFKQWCGLLSLLLLVALASRISIYSLISALYQWNSDMFRYLLPAHTMFTCICAVGFAYFLDCRYGRKRLY